MTSSWSGRLLVASPLLVEDTFARTVVQLLQHDEENGAVGVVLNRPSRTPLSEILPGWELQAGEEAPVFMGGPVQPSAAICLALLQGPLGDDPSYTAVPGAPWLGTVDLDLPAGTAIRQVRVFAGYAGWTAGQLEDEVGSGAWWVCEALPGDCFASDPAHLWHDVLRRQGFPLSLVASYPADPGLN